MAYQRAGISFREDVKPGLNYVGSHDGIEEAERSKMRERVFPEPDNW